MLRTLTPDQLVDALLEGLKDNNTPQDLAAVKAQSDQMVQAMKAYNEIKEGDVVTIDFIDGATHIARNGAGRVTIAGDAFNRALTRVWLGDKPAQADLKRAMLGS